MRHAGNLTTNKTLCSLDTSSNLCGWVFTEDTMLLQKGQQSSLFESMVSCEVCKQIAKETLVKDICECCGQKL